MLKNNWGQRHILSSQFSVNFKAHCFYIQWWVILSYKHSLWSSSLRSLLTFELGVAGLSNSNIRPAGKGAKASLNWSCGDGGLEEVSTATGRCRDSREPSRLCRGAMFHRWLQVSLKAVIALLWWLSTSSGTWSSHDIPRGVDSDEAPSWIQTLAMEVFLSAAEPRGSMIYIASLSAGQQLRWHRRNHSGDVWRQQAGRQALPDGAAAVCGLPAGCRFRGVAQKTSQTSSPSPGNLLNEWNDAEWASLNVSLFI